MHKHPGLPASMQTCGDEAEILGLHLAQFNSGTRGHPLNGFRAFPGTAWRDYFCGDHVAQCSTRSEVEAFLKGYGLGRKATEPGA